MKKSIVYKTVALAALSALALTGCQDEDYGWDAQKIKNHEYAKHFKEIFGEIDPNHDWSMASQVTASIDLSEINEICSITISTKSPINGKNSILYTSTIEGGSPISIKFDAPKTSDEVYILVKSNSGLTPISSYFNIKDSKIDTRVCLSITRSETACPVTRGNQIPTARMGTYSADNQEVLIERTTNNFQYSQYQLGEEDGYAWVKSKNLLELIQKGSISLPIYIEGSLPYTFIIYNTISETISVSKDEWTKISSIDGIKYYHTDADGYWGIDYGTPAHYERRTLSVDFANTYYLDGLEKTDGGSVYISDIHEIVGTNKVFAERGGNSSNPQYCNLAKWYNQLSAENGAEYILAEDGPVEFDYIYGGTQHVNEIGYFFYPDGMSYEEAIKQPHYVLGDARPAANVKVDGSFMTHGETDNNNGMSLPGYVSAYERDGTDHLLTATHYKLAYFASADATQGSYIFPKGTHVVFFLVNGGLTISQDYGYNMENSVPECNKLENKIWLSSRVHAGDSQYCNMSSAVGNGELDAVTYNWGGTTILGFEDRDEDDMNDVLLFVKGKFTNTFEELKTEDETYEWMVACEDLGGTFDYDFNDIVFGVKKYGSRTTLFKEFYLDGVLQSSIPTQVSSDYYLMITPYAACAALKSYIGNSLYGTTQAWNGTVETHELITGNDYSDIASGSMPLINPETKGSGGTPIVISLTEEEYNNFTMNNSGFTIKVKPANGGADHIVTSSLTQYDRDGDVTPQMLTLPKGWIWPKERNEITLGYPKFADWVKDVKNDDWYKDYNTSYLVGTPTIVEENGESINPIDPSSWNIQISGANTIERGASETYTVSIAEISELSDITAGSSSSCISDVVVNNDGTVTITASETISGSGSFWVEYPEDETHQTTRVSFDIEVLLPQANFTVSISSVSLNIGDTQTFSVEGDGNNDEYTLSSNKENVAIVSTTGIRYGTNTITAIGPGDATITITYKKDATHRLTEKQILVHVNEAAPNITSGTYNPIVPSPTTFTPSWGGDPLQDYKLSVGNYSCPEGLKATITVSVTACPSNEIEIFTKDNSGLGRMQLYNGSTSVSKELTNEQLKKLLAGQFSIVNYASSDIEITSISLKVEEEE